MPPPFRQILGIKFYTGEMPGLFALTAQGGLMVVPSAPVLVALPQDPALRTAVESSDFALTDSGLMVLLWRCFTGEKLPRISGLRFLRALLSQPAVVAPGATFWVMPSEEELAANLAWLNAQGHPVIHDHCYVAPLYPAGPVSDPTLLALIEQRQPAYIFLNIGGGVQERLGYYLRRNLSAFGAEDQGMGNGRQRTDLSADLSAVGLAKVEGLTKAEDRSPSSALRPPSSAASGSPPAIICTGAAIAFLSGRQANIPPWADRFMLGWLLRTLSDPGRYFPRYWKAIRLAPLLWKHRERSVTAR